MDPHTLLAPLAFRPASALRQRAPRPLQPTALARAAIALLVAATLVAFGRGAGAQRRHRHHDDGEASYTAPAVRVAYVDRPLTTTFRHLDLYAGVGFEYLDFGTPAWASYYPGVNRQVWGVGATLEASYGVTRWLELGAGFGARVAENRETLTYVSPDRYARVNREWLPTNLELARTPLTLGGDYLTNPYAHARIAFVNHAPVLVGLDVYLTAPIVAGTCFTADLGVPLHFAIAHRVRIETGVFSEFVPCNVNVGVPPRPEFATRYWTLMVPLRVIFQLTERFWLGLRTGFESVGYSLDSRNIAVPLGLEAGVRLIPRLDLLFQVVAPEFVHTDSVTNQNVWFNRIGTGVAIQAWLF